MSASSSSAEVPSSGDVVIVEDRTVDKGRFVLSVWPHPGQIRCDTYQQALTSAARWASTCDAAMWFRDDRGTHTLLSSSGEIAYWNAEATRASHGE